MSRAYPLFKKMLCRFGFASFLLVGVLTLFGCNIIGVGGVADIAFPETMITLEGREVDELSLERGEASVLTYKRLRDSSIQVHPEIRKEQTIRLGGYFYRGFENGRHISNSQITWVGNNLDVISFNMYGAPEQEDNIYPKEIKSIKEKNPHFSLYLMVYGTTMVEPIFDPATMSDWTLKNNNGEEVMGLRRRSEDSKNHVMDMKNQEYRDFFGKYITEHAHEYHADGVAIDEIMWEGYWGIETDEIQGYDSKEDYYNASLGFLQALDSVSTTKIIHQAFWDEAQDYSNGVWGEGAFKYHYNRKKKNVFYKGMNYGEVVNNLLKVSSRKDAYIWSAWYRENNLEDLKYAVATYLLGKGSNTAVLQLQPLVQEGEKASQKRFYDLSEFQEEYRKHKEYLDVELGNPVAKPEQLKDRGLWLRKYEKGIVVAYPK